ELLPDQDPRRSVASQQLRWCEGLLGLEKKLETFLKGEDTLTDSNERLNLAWLYQLPYQQRYHAAARLYAVAFAEQPKRADNLRSGNRYRAARAAILAAACQGKDADKLDDQERVCLRSQALDWLRTDLAAWAKLVKETPKVGPTVRQTLTHWQKDP